MSETSFDQEKFTRMLSRVSEALSGTLVMQLCFIGDRLGLFKDLAERGPATSDQTSPSGTASLRATPSNG